MPLDTLTLDIDLSLLDDNPFNSRLKYDGRKTSCLASSLSQVGLLSPIRVRAKGQRYEIVCGHRRVRAARLLDWKTIRAEIVRITDDEMLSLSLVENMERENLSDFEKAQSLLRMHEKFGKTLDEISKLVGISKEHISNFNRMARMFDERTLSDNPSLLQDLHRLTEHHARILLQIEDQSARINAVRLAASQGLSVRELQRMVHRLRSWFGPSEPFHVKENTDNDAGERKVVQAPNLAEIENALSAEFELPHQGDFEGFLRYHAIDKGFSLYSNFPPFRRFDDNEAIEKERNWFFSVAPKLHAEIHGLRVRVFGEMALATLYVDYSIEHLNKRPDLTARGTVIFIRNEGSWKILHEHWSRLNESPYEAAV